MAVVVRRINLSFRKKKTLCEAPKRINHVDTEGAHQCYLRAGFQVNGRSYCGRHAEVMAFRLLLDEDPDE